MPSAPGVEAGQAEALLAELARNDAGDQKPGEDEEHVDADKTARHRIRKGVVQHHQRHRDRSKPIDIWPVARPSLPHKHDRLDVGSPANCAVKHN